MTRQLYDSLPPAHVDDHFIDGRWRSSSGSRRTELVDPATEEVWGSAAEATPADIDAAMSAADKAFRGGHWSRMSPSRRATYLLRIATEIEHRAEQLALTITRENGSPWAETTGAAANAAAILRSFAGLADRLERNDVRPFPNGAAESVVRRDPVGVCVLISPWNFPITLVVSKLAPALLAGCTVVIKPAPSTPLSIRLVIEAVEAAGVPAGVVNLVSGSASAGQRLVQHPLTAKVAFTGSTSAGRKIATTCGELLRPVTLELGGKSSAIVLPDADLDAMAATLIRTCLRNTGQTCYAATRILAPTERYDEVVAMVTRVIAGAKVGDPLDDDTVFGPMATRAQYEKVLGFLASGHEEGARATTGGGAADMKSGYYIEPTVFADVTAGMRIAREEIFGPVIGILRYTTVREAIELANGTGFGLGGVVFSQDPVKALSVAERLDTGSVGVNFFASNPAAPFGGRRDSGLGVEFGFEGLAAYLTYKSIHHRPALGQGS